MNSFKIENTEFEVGNVSLAIKNHFINLEISASETVFYELSEKEDNEWGWALYPPKIYFRNVPYKDETIIIDKDLLEKCDIALYMMEHNTFTGVLEISDNLIHICGLVDMMGKPLPFSVNIDRSEL